MTPPRIVVMRALGLGDLLTVVPALRGIRRAHPEHRIELLAPAWLGALAHHVGAIDAVVPTPDIQPLAPAQHHAAVAVNLHGRGPQSTGALLAARPERVVAFRHDAVPQTRDAPTWDPAEHEVDRWCRLLTEYGIHADPADLHIPPPPADEDLPPLPHDYVVLHPGASTGARRWPVDRWARVASTLDACGHPVVLTGGADERAPCAAVADGAGRGSAVTDLSGRTTVLGLAAVIAGAALVVSGDTGAAHLATALARPSVVLFGPEPPSRWGPRSGPHAVIWKGRVGDPRADALDPGLAQITVDDVLTATTAPPTVGARRRPSRA